MYHCFVAKVALYYSQQVLRKSLTYLHIIMSFRLAEFNALRISIVIKAQKSFPLLSVPLFAASAMFATSITALTVGGHFLKPYYSFDKLNIVIFNMFF